MDAVIGDGVHPHMGEGADVVVGAEVAAVNLAGVDGGALVHGAVLDEAVGADDTARADDGLAAQDGARQNGGTRRNDHALVDLHGAACDVYAVCDVAQQERFPLCLGFGQLCAGSLQRVIGNRFHKRIPPSG